MPRFILSPEAEHDLDVIKMYLLESAGMSVTRNVMRELREAMRFFARQPDAGHFREDLTDAPVRFWSVFSYLVVYDPRKRPIEIVRVLHGNRDVAAILDTATES
jgi:toxin ParE1/3/4